MQSAMHFYPLSQSQQSIWYLEKTFPNTTMNVVAGSVRFKRRTNFALLEKAIHLFIQKNQAMRLRVVEQAGVPMQYVPAFSAPKIELFDFSQDSGPDRLYRWDEAQTQKVFPLIDSDLYYFAMIKVSDEDGGFYVKTHHLISDAWSMGIMGSQIVAYYAALEAGETISDEPNPDYLTILNTDEQYLQSERFLKDKAYWEGKFADHPEATRIKPPHSSVIDTRAQRKTLLTPVKLSNKIRQFCEENRVSVFTLFLSALCMYLNRTAEKEDVIIGTTLLNRSSQQEKKTVGMFASIGAPIRVGINGDLDFKTFVKEMTGEAFSVLRHQKYPYNLLLDHVNREHNLSGNLFDLVLTYQNSKMIKGPEMEYVTRWHFPGHQLESLIININDRDDGGCLVLDYDFLTDVFHVKEVEFIHQHLISLLWHALDNPLNKVSRLEMLSEKEKQRVLYEFNNTQADFPQDKILPQLFEEQVVRTPDHVAVVYEQTQLSYRVLNERANQLAHLLQARGVGPDSVVGLCLYRSLEMMIGLMAIVKAGGAYMPISPEAPPDRIRYMLEDSGAQLVLTQSALLGELQVDAELIALEDPRYYSGSTENPKRETLPQNLAYIIYTSGSTGRPKGAMIEHRSIVNRIHWMQKKYPLTEQSVILQKTPFTFDVSVWELFWWSFVGAKVCMLAPGGEKDPAMMIAAIEREQITTMHFVPSMLSIFLDFVEKRGIAGKLSSLRQVFASGEALTLPQVDAFNRLLYVSNGTALSNLYGPTEAAVDVSYFDCSPAVTLKTVPIGRPIDNIRLYILDKNRSLLPVGIPGELYIAGVGVGRGYINNPELTAAAFVPDPFYPGQVMYKTGDRVRWFPGGDIEYLGRIDFQVKIRGFRIELGEIESRLRSHEDVSDAVVVGQAHNGATYLCAYLLADRQVKRSGLKTHLLRDLPEYMVPAYFIFLDSLPLSANGKLNRKALPEPDYSEAADEAYVAPANEMEERIAAMWREILGVDQVGVEQSFFSLGGNSLRAIALITEIQQQLQFELSVRDMFRLQTVRRISDFLQDAQKGSYTPIPRQEDADGYPLSSAQKRLFVLNQLAPDDISYNLPGVMSIDGKLDPDRVEEVFRTLIARHESLRTSFSLRQGEPVQRLDAQTTFSLLSLEAQKDDVDAVIDRFIAPFDLSCAPLLRAGLLNVADGRQLLLFDMHHIISDGASMNVLIAEFADLYAGVAKPMPTLQYRDFVAWHQEQQSSPAMAEKERYWLDRFADEIPILNMPTDFPRPASRSFYGTRRSWQLSPELTGQLKALAGQTGTTLYTVLLAAYNVLLSRYTAQDDITVGIPTEGRLHSDLREMIGIFVNTLAIRNRPSSNKNFDAFLAEVNENLLAAYENQEYPFELLVERAKVKRDLGRNPLFDTVFILQNVDLRKLPVGDAVLRPYPFKGKSSKFDLTVEAYDYADTMELIAEYRTDLFTEETIDRLLGHFEHLLGQIVARPDQTIGALDLLDQAERQCLLVAFNDSDADYPHEKTITQLFEAQAADRGEEPALLCAGETLSYRGLNERVNQLAWTLRERGVGRESIVAISVGRSFEMIVGMLAILKAGGAYLPMDPDYPPERIAYMLRDSGTKWLLTGQRELEHWKSGAAPGDTPIDTSVQIIDLYDGALAQGRSENPGCINTPHDLAYIIYTSGSTGRPKGVMIEHENLVRLLFNSRFQFRFDAADVWTMFHSFCFDFSVWEMYGALLYGGRLVIVPKQVATDTRQFLHLLKEQRVSVLNQTPAAFYNLVAEDGAAGDCDLALRYVIFGGEALKPILLKPFWQRYPRTRLINMYGITETTVHVTFKELTAHEIEHNISNVGRAIPTLKTYILDQNLHLLPIGVPGELCVSGAGLGRGYLNNPALTAQRFVQNPYAPEERLYRSGDLAKVLPNGDLEYLGRIDNQVKIRGFRIELGEIESALLQYPGVSEALVIARASQSGERKLYAYFVAGSTLSASELRSHLSKGLPDYMIPAYLVQLDRIPLNKNGKADRDNLPRYDEAVDLTAGYVAPQNETEELLSQVWADVLELPQVGVSDNFFELGGDSLGAIKAVVKISDAFGQTVPLSDLYHHPTVRQMAQRLVSEPPDQPKGMLLNLTPHATGDATNIICFPYGGGNALNYQDLSAAFARISNRYRVFAINLPGHDMAEGDALLPVEEIAASLCGEIEALPGELVLYGHCVGTALSLETARLLTERNRPINRLFLGGIFPPKGVRWYGNFLDPWALHSDEQILSHLNLLGLQGKPQHRDYIALVLRAFRHDVRSFYRYFYNISKSGFDPLPIPIDSIVGQSDPETKQYATQYQRWDRFGSGVQLHVLPGASHYFINSHADALAATMIGRLEEQRLVCAK